MILNSRAPVKLTPRADFKPEQFRKTIFSHGLNVKWEQASECPCSQDSSDYGFQTSTLASSSGALNTHRSDCPACKGRGYLYHSSQTIKAVVTGARKQDERFSQVGGSEYSDGSIGVTLLPEHLPALGDKFTLLQSAIVFRETIVKQAGDTSTRYPIVSRDHDLAGGGVSFGVRYLIPANDQNIVDPNANLVEGTDFNIVNGAISWINAIDDGLRFSVEYYANPVYVVTNHPHVIRDSMRAFKAPAPYHIELPVYAEAKLEFYGANDD